MKAKHFVIFLLAAGLFFGCEPKASDKDSGNNGKSGENIPPPEKDTSPTENQPGDSPKESVGSTYTFHDVVYDISLHVTRKAGAIDFSIDVSNLDNNCKRSVKGTATEKEGDLESREMDGEAVFVQEYVYNGDDCELYISIDLDSESAAWITEGECKDSDPMCPLGPDAYLSLSN